MSRIAETGTNAGKDLKILEDVLVKIAEIAAADVDGVCGLVKSRVHFADLFTGAGRSPLIDVRISGGAAEISLGINVAGGKGVKAVAEKTQQRIKDDVQSMTGIPVTKVNVFVYGIVFEENV